jgi:hypothetical protein
MRKVNDHFTLRALRIGIASALATGAVIGVVSLAGERAVWAQGGQASASACRSGVRPGRDSSSVPGHDGNLEPSGYEFRLCGERGRFSFSMGGAPFAQEFESTTRFFPPDPIANPSVWFPGVYPYHPLCDDVPSASDLPGAKLTVRLISYDSTADTSTTLTLAPDTDKPSLKTTSVPPKGTRVKAGGTIKVRMDASEEYGATRHGWQTGVKKILLRDESKNQNVSPHFENNGRPQPCERKLWKKSLEVTYTVPENPPPIIRLRAIAEDFAGNKDDDVAEFPTGELWKGTVKLERDGRNPQCSAVTSETEFIIAVADDGTVTGSGTLDHSKYTCLGGYTTPATHAPVAVGGKKQAGVFTLFLSDWPKTAMVPRLPVGQWIVQVGQGSSGEGTFAPGRMTDVVFRVKLECQNCGHP